MCDDAWDANDAGVVCAQLGYSRFSKFSKYMYDSKAYSVFFLLTDATAFAGGRFGQGTGPIFVDNTACSGNEPRLLNCGYDTDTTDCTHAEDAGLRCSGRCKFVPVLLHIIRLRAL